MNTNTRYYANCGSGPVTSELHYGDNFDALAAEMRALAETYPAPNAMFPALRWVAVYENICDGVTRRVISRKENGEWGAWY